MNRSHTIAVRASRPAALAAMLIGALTLAGCSGFGGSAPQTGGLAPGLVAQMDRPGAQLDQGAAFSLLNQFRATRGAAPFRIDPALTASAQSLARSYAATGTPPAAPAGATARFSAGYTTFADTFSGWRSTPADAAMMASGVSAGLAMVYDAQSTYGTYWVLLVGN